MSDLSVQKIDFTLDIYSLRHIMNSDALTDVQKVNFIKRNSTVIKGIMEIELGTDDFNKIMNNRPLLLFRPLKNAFTKNGDKVLLAKTLSIPPNLVDNFVGKAIEAIPDKAEISFYTKEQIEALKTYIFRHGSQEQVIKFLDYELSHCANIKATLQKTLEYSTGGVADYFTRPVHRMKNKTLLGLFEIINKNLELRKAAGEITEDDVLKISKAALARIYQLQENSKFRNSAKLKKEIEKK